MEFVEQCLWIISSDGFIGSCTVDDSQCYYVAFINVSHNLTDSNSIDRGLYIYDSFRFVQFQRWSLHYLERSSNYALRIRNIGLPTLDKSYFSSIWLSWPNKCQCLHIHACLKQHCKPCLLNYKYSRLLSCFIKSSINAQLYSLRNVTLSL